MSRKRHSVVKIHLSYRKSRSLERMAGSDINSRFCVKYVKICPKLAYIVVKSPQFYPFYKKSCSLNTMVKAVFFITEAELTLFLRMRTKEIAKT